MEGIDNKVEIINLFNGWNDKNERIIISIGENASSYKWLHEKSAKYYNYINKILNILLIIFSTSLSAESFIPSNNTTLKTNIEIVRKIFVYIITIISVVQNFLKYEKLSNEHLQFAKKFSTIYHSIQQEMCMYRRHRKNATKYLSDILKQYDSLVIDGPTINNIILDNYKKTFKTDLPDITDKQKIEIITENNNNNDTPINILSSKSLNCNLDDIQKIFQIHGDISDNDIQNCNNIELKEIKEKYKIV